jgi:ectoine hydroxylase-related dioxygenase (phytanoyl-CoA dioxygenase family)
VSWYTQTDARCHRGGYEAVQRFNEAILARRQKYPVSTEKNKEIVDNLLEKGYYVIENAFAREKVAKIREDFEKQLELGKNMKELNKHFAVIEQPLVHCPSIFDFAFNDRIIDIASEYFKCLPALGTLNLRRSYESSGTPIKHQIFHSDPNSIKFIKFFLYLEDVAVENGPFTIVENSLNNKFQGWTDKYRWSDEEMRQTYGKDSIKYITANVGDLIIANTTAFHKGTPPMKGDRTMITLNYTIHPEDWNKPTYQIKQEDYDRLSDDKKPLADFLVRI